MTELCKQHPEKLLVTIFQRGSDGVLELLTAVLNQLTARRQLHTLDFFASGTLN